MIRYNDKIVDNHSVSQDSQGADKESKGFKLTISVGPTMSLKSLEALRDEIRASIIASAPNFEESEGQAILQPAQSRRKKNQTED